jgi:hypothetical protein
MLPSVYKVEPLSSSEESISRLSVSTSTVGDFQPGDRVKLLELSRLATVVETSKRAVIVEYLKQGATVQKLIRDLGSIQLHQENNFNSDLRAEADEFQLEAKTELCPFFVQGKCKFKARCKLSHELTRCCHCFSELPTGKVAASAHLSRCWKKTSTASSKVASMNMERIV